MWRFLTGLAVTAVLLLQGWGAESSEVLAKEIPGRMNFAARIQAPSKQQVFAMDGYYVWGGSTVRGNDGKYHLFCSRWPAEYGMSGWLSHSQIVRAVSAQPEGPFEFQEELAQLKGQPWAANMVHNPSVFRYKEDFYLAYIGATWAGQNPEVNRDNFDRHAIRFTQRIGLAKASDAAGPWMPLNSNPILEPREGEWDFTFVTNPSVCVSPEGEILMMYKSTRGAKEPLLLGLTKAKHPEGPYLRIGREPLFEHDIEDPYLWYEEGLYWMLSKDMTGELVGEKGAGILYSSKNGTDWELAQNRLAYPLTIQWADGGESKVSRMERPQLLVEGGRAICIYTAILPDGKSPSWNLARRLSVP